MNWDDLRVVLALSDVGSLAKAAQRLGVDHTTVGRRVDALEGALRLKLFTRSPRGYVATADAERLLEPLRRVEAAVHDVERVAAAADVLAGTVKVTAPETFGASYLAPRLAVFGREHPQVRIELALSGTVFDLGRREAEIAVRPFRSKQENLVVRKVATVAYGLYGSSDYLRRRPVLGPQRLHEHCLLSSPDQGDLEARWLQRLDRRAQPTLASTLSLALLSGAKASAGLAVLPRYLGDLEPSLRLVPMPDPPHEDMWLTVHRDLQRTPRVRALLDFLGASMATDARQFTGAS
ncbi:MAG: LysR family transcriptional regulator [Myxococcaceae bacterium]